MDGEGTCASSQVGCVPLFDISGGIRVSNRQAPTTSLAWLNAQCVVHVASAFAIDSEEWLGGEVLAYQTFIAPGPVTAGLRRLLYKCKFCVTSRWVETSDC